jgi:hypothetical protein
MDSNIGHRSASPKMKKAVASRRSVLVSLLLLPAILLGLWLDHGRLLQGAARIWVVDDPVEPADAVAIFGGGIETRPAAAAEYFRQGLVHKILVAHSGSAVEYPPSRSHTAQNLAELKKLGVADNAIEIFGCDLSDTFQEALALKRWSLHSGAHRLIVPTEYFSARRVRWITQRVFQDSGAHVRVPVTSSPYYLQGEWWNHMDAPLAFGREVVKYVSYRLIYGPLLSWYEPGNSSERCAN